MRNGESSLVGRFRAARFFTAVSTLALIGACASGPPPAPKNAAAARSAAAAPAGGALTAGAPVALLPLAAARPLQLAAISITSLDRLLTNGATLAGRAVPLPIEPASLRDMLLGQAGLSPEVAANLDLAGPSGAVVVSTGQMGGTGLVMVVAARGPAETESVIGVLGKQVAKRGAVVLVDNGSGGKGWLFRDGNLIVFSDDLEALSRGARLAEEARHAGPEDVTAVLYPEAIARANGTDVKTAIALATLQIAAAQQAAQASGSGAGVADHSLESMTQMLSLIGDAETVELGLVVDSVKGVGLRARLRAKPGTPLEGVARDTRPFEVDTTLLSGGGPPVVVAASSVGPFARSLMVKQRERLAAAKAKAALEYYDAYMAGLAGQFSLVLTVSREAPLFSALVSYPMKDAAAAANLFAAMGRMDKAAVAAVVEAQMGSVPAFDWSVKKESVGKLKANHFAVSFGKKSGLDLDMVKKVLGKALDVYVAVAGTRVVATMGKNAKPNLSRLATAPATAPSGALAEALAAAKNRDSFFFMDLGPALSLAGVFAKDARAAALARAGTGAGSIPFFGTAGGDGAGKVWSMDLTIPPAAFVGAGAIVKGMSGAASAGDEKDKKKDSKKDKKKDKKAKKKPASKVPEADTVRGP
jgi:hypothetical protein